jgi:proteic killer suppression protein
MAIRSFKDRRCELLFEGQHPKGFPPDLVRLARRKLRVIDAATTVRDLKEPPGNRLEKLRGNREGQWSIRVNDQWRICFVWTVEGAHDVEVVDYH